MFDHGLHDVHNPWRFNLRPGDCIYHVPLSRFPLGLPCHRRYFTFSIWSCNHVLDGMPLFIHVYPANLSVYALTPRVEWKIEAKNTEPPTESPPKR